MSATVLAAMLAGGLGLVAGGYYSTMGWIVVANLLLVTMATACFVAHADLLTALGWMGLGIIAFNIGLMSGLLVRHPVTTLTRA
jgi:hypothetical protein